jgi:hypothetical protein
MIEKKKMVHYLIARPPAAGLVDLFRFAYPHNVSEGLDRPLQGLVFDGFSPFAAAQARDPLRRTAR